MGAKVPACISVIVRRWVILTLVCEALLPRAVQGQVTWKRSYGGSGTDQGFAVCSISNGGAVICGSTGSFGSGGDAYVFEVDVNGDVQWSRILGGAGVDVAADVCLSSSDEPVIAGYTNSQGVGGYDGLLVKLDASGSQVWERTYGGAEWDLFHAIAETSDGFVAAGSSSSFNPDALPEAWLVRLDASGEMQWSATIDTLPDAVFRDVSLDGSGRIIAIGTSRIGTLNQQMLVACCSSGGDWIWARELGGAGSEIGYGTVIQPNGTVMAVGYTESFASHRQMFLGRVAQDGTVLSASAVSTAGDDWEARSIATKPDGDYVMAGYTREYGAGGKDYYLMTTDPLGNIQSGPSFGGGSDDEPWDVSATGDGAFYLVGTTTSYGPGASAVFVVRCVGDTLNGTVVTFFDSVGLMESEGQSARNLLYPNPARVGDRVLVRSEEGLDRTLTIHDATGREVGSASVIGGGFLVPGLTAGYYMAACGSRERHRLVIE